MPATPPVGWIWAEATCISVVLPAPLGPRTTQRSSSSTVQSIPSRRVASPRRTVTPANWRTGSISSSARRRRHGSAVRTADVTQPTSPCLGSRAEPRTLAAWTTRYASPSGSAPGPAARRAWTTPGTPWSVATPPTTWSGCPAYLRRRPSSWRSGRFVPWGPARPGSRSRWPATRWGWPGRRSSTRRRSRPARRSSCPAPASAWSRLAPGRGWCGGAFPRRG